MCNALHSNLPPLQQWAKGPGVAVAHHLAALAPFDRRPRHRVSRQLNARESLEATVFHCLQGNEAVVDDGDIVSFFGGPATPLTSTAQSEKGTERYKVDVVTVVAPNGMCDTLAANHDFIIFRRGMQSATCKQVVRIWCNTCLVCYACFSTGSHPCTEVVVNVAHDVCEDG